MDDVVTLDSLRIMIQIISKMYDSVRMVDPFKKKIVLFSHEEEKLNSNGECYSLWHNGKVCENCVSSRALYENKAIV